MLVSLRTRRISRIMVRISVGRLSRPVFLLFAVQLLDVFEFERLDVACSTMDDAKDGFV